MGTNTGRARLKDGWMSEGINPRSRQRNKCDMLRLLLFSRPSLQINWEYFVQTERRRHQNVDAEWRKKSGGTVGKHKAAQTQRHKSNCVSSDMSEGQQRLGQESCPAGLSSMSSPHTPGRKGTFTLNMWYLSFPRSLGCFEFPHFRYRSDETQRCLLKFYLWHSLKERRLLHHWSYAGVGKPFRKPLSVSSALRAWHSAVQADPCCIIQHSPETCLIKAPGHAPWQPVRDFKRQILCQFSTNRHKHKGNRSRLFPKAWKAKLWHPRPQTSADFRSQTTNTPTGGVTPTTSDSRTAAFPPVVCRESGAEPGDAGEASWCVPAPTAAQPSLPTWCINPTLKFIT